MRIAVATPVRGTRLMAPVTVGYSESLRKLSRRMQVDEIAAAITFGADVVRARNRIAALVLREFPKITHVLWWDDDEWPEDVDIVGRMIATGEDFIAAPYTNKVPPIRWHHQSKTPRELDARGLLEVDYCALGFTLTSISCLRKVAMCSRRYTDYRADDPNPKVVANMFGQLYCGPGDETDSLLSEDYSFCERWCGLGGRIWIDGRAGNIVEHVGQKASSARDMVGGVASPGEGTLVA